MDHVRPAGPAVRRTGSLLALALLASTALSALTPATATTAAPLVEVVVTSTGAGVAAAADAVRAAGGTVRDALPLVGGVSADLPAGAVLAPAFRVVENHPITLAGKGEAGKNRQATGIRQALGLGAPAGEGAGVTIAVVDTGVTPSDAFTGRLTHLDVSGSWQEGELHDPYGHGTFVAGIAAGGGDGPFAGVAPAANVLDVRVADERGETDLLTVLRGLEAVSDHNLAAADNPSLDAVDVVNLSLSSGSPLPYQIDPLTVALSTLWASGVVVVVPSGNDGGAAGSVTSPGVDPTLLTVGALDHRATLERGDDAVAAFSGRGPTPQQVNKPDLVAPGQSLVSLRATGSRVDQQNRKARVGADGAADPDGAYFRGSGTSFSTAAVSGAAAALLQADPTAGPDSVKTHLSSHTYGADVLGGLDAAGAGALDLPAALEDAIVAVPPAERDLPPLVEQDVAAWHAFLTALLDKERQAAGAAWDLLSQETRTWAASRWALVDPEASRWAANSWSASRWADADVSADTWMMRHWAASRWAASRWASDDLVASRWAANSWSASRWAGPDAAASRWADKDFAASRWADKDFAASRWADEDFAASRWAASRWAASRWAASRWAASRWSAASWN